MAKTCKEPGCNTKIIKNMNIENCKNCGSNDIINHKCQHCKTNYAPEIESNRLKRGGLVIPDPIKSVKIVYSPGERDPYI